MNPFNCEFVMVGGYWLPTVAGLSRTPVYIGDYDRAYSGVLRTAHVGKAHKWRVLLQGVPSEDVPLVEEILRSPEPVGCNVMGVECIASVTEISSVHDPIKSGPKQDWGRMNYEIQIEETWAEHVLPGFMYEYMAFMDTGAFTWDWDEAGQPETVDVLLVAGGGGGGGDTATPFGYGGGGAGGVRVLTGLPVSGNVAGSVGAGGAAGSNGSNSTFGAQVATGGGAGASSANGNTGGSGGGARQGGTPGAGTSEQGNTGGAGNAGSTSSSPAARTGGAGGGGGAGGAGGAGGVYTGHPLFRAGGGGPGGMGVDLLSIGWNYRLVAGAPRFVGGGGGGSGGRRLPLDSGLLTGGEVGGGGVGGGGSSARMSVLPSGVREATDGVPNTGGGGGGGAGSVSGSIGPLPGGAGGSGLVIVRWLVQ